MCSLEYPIPRYGVKKEEGDIFSSYPKSYIMAVLFFSSPTVEVYKLLTVMIA
jgi:hypothetical protein